MITPDAGSVATEAELLALARALDEAAAEQLEELSQSFAMSNNRDGAAELRHLAGWKAGHAAALGVPAAAGIIDWYVVDPGDPEALHYLMRPWHLVGVAIDNERRLRQFFVGVAEGGGDAALKAAAARLAARQDQHVAELEARQRGLPEPESGWDDDPDPPFFDQ